MKINRNTVNLYIRESETKIEIALNDIKTYEYRIKQTQEEIETLKYFIQQYKNSLELIGDEDAQEDNE